MLSKAAGAAGHTWFDPSTLVYYREVVELAGWRRRAVNSTILDDAVATRTRSLS